MLEKLRKELKQLEIIVKNIKEHIGTEQERLIINLFTKLNSPLERISLLEELDTKIIEIDEGINFRTTENSIVYQVNDQNFMAVYPQVNALRIEHIIPEGWGNCKITNESEIDEVIVLIKKSYDLMRKKKK